MAAVRESKETIRPDFMQRLVGTLADVIARAAHQEAAAGKHSPTHPDRMPEIIGLLQTAFEVGLRRVSHPRCWPLQTTFEEVGLVQAAFGDDLTGPWHPMSLAALSHTQASGLLDMSRAAADVSLSSPYCSSLSELAING